MKDRELLELAAKAANIPIKFTPEGIPFHAEMQGNPGFRCWVAWNPLADDGDALRLAVSMNMGISIYDVQVTAASAFGMPVKEHDKDTAKATRRAIVRAAAEIGRAIP